MSTRKLKPSTPPRSPARPATERIVAQLSRHLAEQQFESDEELNAYFLRELSQGGGIPRPVVPSKHEQAWELLERAQESRSPKRRRALARQALVLDPDNADAFLFLSEESATPAESMTWLAEAVRAGGRSLPESIETLAAEGAVWLVHESRPYMRARAALAVERWYTGDRQPAIAELWDLLRLNPGDNQGLRYVLLGWLLSAGSLADIDRLVALYPDDAAAAWAYDRTLHAFRTTGDSTVSRKLLQSALRVNRHVPAILLGTDPLPETLPDYVGYGDELEAAAYVSQAFLRWSEYPEAVEWLITKTGKPSRSRAQRVGPLEM